MFGDKKSKTMINDSNQFSDLVRGNSFILPLSDFNKYVVKFHQNCNL